MQFIRESDTVLTTRDGKYFITRDVLNLSGGKYREWIVWRAAKGGARVIAHCDSENAAKRWVNANC